MGDAARELPDGFHLLGLGKAALAFSQRLLDVLAVAQVVNHPREVAAAIGRKLADREMQGKGGAVLAAPAAAYSISLTRALSCAEILWGRMWVRPSQ